MVDSICDKLGDDLENMLSHKYGNYLFQRLVAVATDEQKRRIINSTRGMFVAAAMTQQGTRSVQALIEACRQEDMLRSIVESIAPRTKELSEDVNGNHVIAQLIKVTMDSIRAPLLEEIRKHCVELCKSKYGCSVVNKCLDTLKDSEYRKLLIREIESDVNEIIRHEYGNYVIQHLIKVSPPSESQKYCQYVLGNICAFSTDMCSSNVVELSIESGDDATRKMIIDEMLSNGDLDKIIQSRYGKYVLHKALLMTTGPLKERLEQAIEMNTRSGRADAYEAQSLPSFRKFECF